MRHWLLTVLLASCMKQVVEPASVTRAGPLFTGPSGAPIKGLEVRFTSCPDVTWTFYLEKIAPTSVAMSTRTVSCLEKLKVGEKVNVTIDVKPLNKTGGTNGGSATQVGKCVLRPRDGDQYEGFLGTSDPAAKTCLWARDESFAR